ncbi:hypothetical protein BDR06DRAFT_1009071 [Suillus hirtellus]|nr:hypothetical protein BDR06DRAFT_1009071 [Suillus hirtellus]
MSHTEGSTSCIENRQHDDSLPQSQTTSESSQTFVQARQRRRIAELEDKLMALKSGRAVKDRQVNYYMSQGRAFRRIVALFDNIEDLVAENDRRYDAEDEETSVDQDRLHVGVRAGIRDRAEGYIVTDLSFPAYLYEKYTANSDNLEEGLFKGKILIQSYKAVFTSPSSAKDVEGDGDGADVIKNNRRAKKTTSTIKVKKHVAQIIKMDKVSPRLIAYIACQVRFALSSITSWRSVNGDFDYVQFWQTIVDFFERPPGQDAQRRVTRLLEWWTRKVFGRSRHADLTDDARAKMSVNTLARQRAQIDDAAFDSD